MKNDIINRYLVFLIFIPFIGILFSFHFIPLFLAGSIFYIFKENLKYQRYYILILTIFIFNIIEVTQGFKLFSLTLVSIFLYILILPYIKKVISSSVITEIANIFLFYLFLFIILIYMKDPDKFLYVVLMINLFIDSILVGFVL